MKLLFLLIFIPSVSYCQLILIPGVERLSSFKHRNNIKPSDTYSMIGPVLQLARLKQDSRFRIHVLSGYQWAKSESFSNVRSIPILAGTDFKPFKERHIGITADLGCRILTASEMKTAYLFDMRGGIWYAFSNNIRIKAGYERTGGGTLVYVQAIIACIPLSRK